MQALLRFYPEYMEKKQGGRVRKVATQQLLKLALWSSPVSVAILAAVLIYGWADGVLVCLLVLLVIVDVARTQGMALLNAARAQRAFGMWSVAEAWGRPLMAWLAVSVFGVSIHGVMAAFFLLSVITLLVMWRFVPHEQGEQLPPSPKLKNEFWKYTLPLLPLGVIGWVSGLGDRYIIGALMTPADVGMYAAIYALASRPMLMLGTIVEATIRPAYQQAVIGKDWENARQYLVTWSILIFLFSALALGIAIIGNDWLAKILLGEAYRHVAYLFPWIVTGYAFLIFSNIPRRICLANGRTKRVLVLDVIVAVLSIITGYVLVSWLGLVGAAIAVPIYFSARLVISLWLAWPWLRQNMHVPKYTTS